MITLVAVSILSTQMVVWKHFLTHKNQDFLEEWLALGWAGSVPDDLEHAVPAGSEEAIKTRGPCPKASLPSLKSSTSHRGDD